MILRCCFSIFLCLTLGKIINGQVTVDDQGYQNVMISFAPNVPSEDGQLLVEAIQELLENTSHVLHTAIGIPIASATFLLPPSWPTKTWKNFTVKPASKDQTARRPDISVDGTEDSPFRIQPVSLQYGGCGVAGHQIILPLLFLTNFPKYPEGTLLAREWLKYRYGVFEENGFKDDDFYPEYYRIPGRSEIRITECTNSKVTYTFKNPITGEVCDMNNPGDFGYCRTYPDEKSAANVTSSLMYFHKGLPNMKHVCGKDGHPHHNTARNKQNSLCNSRSIWDVVKTSDDFKKTQQKPTNAVQKPIQFSYIQENKPRLIVLLENSDNLHGKEKPILFALRRLYYDLQPKSNFGIFTYNSNVTAPLAYGELSSEDRRDLGAIADFGSPPTNVCTSCGLDIATKLLQLLSKGERSSILLITASPLDKVPQLPENLNDSGICLRVLSFTEEGKPDKSYDVLNTSFNCFSHGNLKTNLDDLETFDGLTSFLRTDVPVFKDDSETKIEVHSGQMLGQDFLQIPKDFSELHYTLWLGKTLSSNSIECKSGNTVVTLKPNTTATDIASFTFDPTDTNIYCKLGSTKLPPILSQIQMTKIKSHFIYDTWIHDMSTDKEQLPIIIYAKVYRSGYPVKYASVTATIESGTKQHIVKMLDNGLGDPDVTMYDGIYSGYFTNFWEAGEYQITVEFSDDNKKAKIGKEIKFIVPDACCGSKILSEDYEVPRFWGETFITYTAKNKRPENGYPPSKILDLKARIFGTADVVIFSWSVPGGGKAMRYTLKVFENRDDAVAKFDTTGRELNVSSMVPYNTGDMEAFYIPFEDLNENVTYYATIRSQNEFGLKSEISNVAEFVPKQAEEASSTPSSTTPFESSTHKDTTPNDPGKNSNKTIAIVFGVLGGIVVVCLLVFLGYYFFIKKSRQN